MLMDFVGQNLDKIWWRWLVSAPQCLGPQLERLEGREWLNNRGAKGSDTHVVGWDDSATGWPTGVLMCRPSVWLGFLVAWWSSGYSSKSVGNCMLASCYPASEVTRASFPCTLLVTVLTASPNSKARGGRLDCPCGWLGSYSGRTWGMGEVATAILENTICYRVVVTVKWFDRDKDSWNLKIKSIFSFSKYLLYSYYMLDIRAVLDVQGRTEQMCSLPSCSFHSSGWGRQQSGVVRSVTRTWNCISFHGQGPVESLDLFILFKVRRKWISSQ